MNPAEKPPGPPTGRTGVAEAIEASESILHPTDLVGSVGIHLLLVVGGFLFSNTSDDGPLFDPDEVMEVKMIELPKSPTRLPQRATKAPPPPPPGEVQAKTPPPPPTASDMKLETPDAEPDKGAEEPDTRDTRRDLLRELQRRKALENLDAPDGRVDRAASDPEGTLEPEDVFAGSASGVAMDPELARYTAKLRKLILPHWAPLPRLVQENPDLSAVVEVPVKTGVLRGRARVAESSGNDSFDQSCARAIEKAGQLPAPPERFQRLTGVWIRFRASDAL